MNGLEKFINGCNRKIGEWKDKLSDIKEDKKYQEGTVKDDYNIIIEKINTKIKVAESDLKELKLVTEDKWKDIEENEEKDWELIEDFVEKALDKFKSIHEDE